MTEATIPFPEAAQLANAWAESLAQVLGQIAGSPFPCAVLLETPAELSAVGESDLWIVCASSGGLRGELSLRLPAASATRLARIFMGEAEPESAATSATPESAAPAESAIGESSAPAAPLTAAAQVTAEHAEAVTELFRQVAGLVSSRLKPQWGEVQLRPEAVAGPPSWPSSSTFWLRAGEPPNTAALIEVHLSAALAAALRAEKSSTASPEPESSPSIATSAATLPPESATDSKVKLDLLLDVELALTLRFGSRSLPLGEILDLNPGAVIELDRQVEDPVDVLLDGRVVARGQVVVMDGNYGLRVTEVGPGGA
jgi:flagellar motor switch protein FliN